MRRPRWTQTEVRVEMMGRDWEVRAKMVTAAVTSSVPGLAVTQGVGSETGWYVITHITSGWKLPRQWAKERAARRMLLNLGAAGDWTRDAGVLEADMPFRAAIRGIVEELSSVPFSNTGSGQ